MAEDQGASSAETFRRDPDFATLYANNIRFEASVWDLKLLFGLLDLSKPTNIVEQHTGQDCSSRF
jgi:hypothetical protein